MADVEFLLDAGFDAAVGVGALALAAKLAPRVRGTGLTYPLLLLFGSVTLYSFADLAVNVAWGMGDAALAVELVRSSYLGSGIALAALLHFVTLYPRRIQGRWIPAAVAAAYAAGASIAALAPTRFTITGITVVDGDPFVEFGPLFWALESVLLAGLLGVLAWTAHLSLHGRSPSERTAGRSLAIAAAGPLVFGPPLAAFGGQNFLAAEAVTIGLGWWIAIASLAVIRGQVPLPAPTTLRVVLDAVSEAVLVCDRSGRVLRANRAASEILGVDPEAAEGRSALDVLGGAVKDPGFASFAQTTVLGVLKGRLEHHSQTLWRFGPQGRLCRLEVLPVRERPDQDVPAAILVRLSDETERQALEAANRRARELQDLVIRVLGHDLKAPLAVVQGYIELLKIRLSSDPNEKNIEAARTALDRMLGATTGMQVLMSNLRAISRLSGGGPDTVSKVDGDISNMTRQAVELLAPIAKTRQQSLTADIPDGLRAHVLPGFDSVPKNLVDNAVKYTPPGGSIEVRLSKSDGVLRLEVSNTGSGIPEEMRPRLFRRFERLEAEKGKVEGTGLGLSIVSTIVELSGGSVGVGDREDGRSGAVFTVELPERQAKTAKT